MEPPEVTGEEAEASSPSESYTSTESFVLHHMRGLQIQISRLHRMQLFLSDRIFTRLERLEAQQSIASCFIHWKLCVDRTSGPERVLRDSLEPQHTRSGIEARGADHSAGSNLPFQSGGSALRTTG